MQCMVPLHEIIQLTIGKIERLDIVSGRRTRLPIIDGISSHHHQPSVAVSHLPDHSTGHPPPPCDKVSQQGPGVRVDVVVVHFPPYIGTTRVSRTQLVEAPQAVESTMTFISNQTVVTDLNDWHLNRSGLYKILAFRLLTDLG